MLTSKLKIYIEYPSILHKKHQQKGGNDKRHQKAHRQMDAFINDCLHNTHLLIYLLIYREFYPSISVCIHRSINLSICLSLPFRSSLHTHTHTHACTHTQLCVCVCLFSLAPSLLKKRSKSCYTRHQGYHTHTQNHNLFSNSQRPPLPPVVPPSSHHFNLKIRC